MLVITAWFLLALGMVVTLGTMWPVISQIWTDQSMGLDANFYNRVCLPFLSVLVLIFAFCPWLGWKGGLRSVAGISAVAGVLVASFVVLFATGMKIVLAALTASAAIAAIVSIVLLFVLNPAMRRSRRTWGAYGIHLGMVLMALGVAFSGPYKIEHEFIMAEGETVEIGGYEVKYVSMVEDRTNELLARATTTLEVYDEGQMIGVMMPDKRIYKNFEQQQFAEVGTIFSLGDEVYSTLLGFTEEEKASFKISVNPLVNWVWIGGTIMCILPFFVLTRIRRPGEKR